MGPTGGYLIGYLPAVFITGYISEKAGNRIGYDFLAMICATVVLYTCGVAWLKILTGMSWTKVLTVGVFPFLIGDALKITAAALIAKSLRPVVCVLDERRCRPEKRPV